MYGTGNRSNVVALMANFPFYRRIKDGVLFSVGEVTMGFKLTDSAGVSGSSAAGTGGF